jgi:hypothetical protein
MARYDPSPDLVPQLLSSSAVDSGIRRYAEALYEISQREVPIKSGTLKRSGKIEKVTESVYNVAYTANHAAMVHEGTKPHIIKAKRGRDLHFTDGGNEVFTPEVHHPGTQANPWLVRSLGILMSMEVT